MFYSQCLLSRKGPLGAIWVAAYCFKRLKKAQVNETDISYSVGSSSSVTFAPLLFWVLFMKWVLEEMKRNKMFSEKNRSFLIWFHFLFTVLFGWLLFLPYEISKPMCFFSLVFVCCFQRLCSDIFVFTNSMDINRGSFLMPIRYLLSYSPSGNKEARVVLFCLNVSVPLFIPVFRDCILIFLC